MRHSLPPADVALAVAAAVVELSGAALEGSAGDEPDLTAFGVVLLLAATLPLVGRRRSPLLVALVTGSSTAVYGVVDLPDPFLPLGPLVALFTVVDQCSRKVALTVTALAVLGSVVASTLAADADGLDYYVALLVVGVAFVLGDSARSRRDVAERERAAAAHRAVGDERRRIARELHDVVAHSVGLVVVQAEAGAAVARDADAVARFDAVAGSGRDALAELRRLLGVLRDDGDRATVEPQPDLGGVADLVDAVRGAGLPVELAVEGAARPVPAAVGLSAYRIVQEALTNALKHAGPARASVTVRYREGGLELEVVDDGLGAGTGGGTGHGLVGIRERVALFGGSVSSGPRPGGGFSVVASLPTDT